MSLHIDEASSPRLLIVISTWTSEWGDFHADECYLTLKIKAQILISNIISSVDHVIMHDVTVLQL